MLALLDFQLLVPPTLYAQYEATVKSPVERLSISVPTSFADSIGSSNGPGTTTFKQPTNF